LAYASINNIPFYVDLAYVLPILISALTPALINHLETTTVFRLPACDYSFCMSELGIHDKMAEAFTESRADTYR
jgi:hypothetical protein